MHRTPTLSLIAFVAAVAAQAQGPTIAATAPSGANCPASSCALEIRRGFFFTVIARADDSTERIGFGGAAVSRAVAGVPDAELEAAAGRRQLVRSNWASGLAIAVFSAALISAYNDFNDQAVLIGIAAVPIGLGGSWYSRAQRNQAMQSFDRAVWFYNRSLRPTITPMRRP